MQQRGLQVDPDLHITDDGVVQVSDLQETSANAEGADGPQLLSTEPPSLKLAQDAVVDAPALREVNT